MSKIIAVHSFRRGAGRTNLVACLATLIGQSGRRVGVIDLDIQSPSMHIFFGISETTISYTLNDYLSGRCDIEQAVKDVSASLEVHEPGRVFLVPAHTGASEIARIMRQGYNVDLFESGCRSIIDTFSLDLLMFDCHAGLTEETLFTIAISDTLIIVMRPDQRDYEGTGVTVQVARRLEVPQVELVVNEVPNVFPLETVVAQVEQTYQCPVATVIYHDEVLQQVSGKGVFVLNYPSHPLTTDLRRLAARLMARTSLV